MDDVVERVHRNGLAFEILGAFDRRILTDDDRMGFVAAADVGGAAGDELKIEAFGMGLVERDHVGPAELQVAGSHALDNHRATRHRHGF